MAIDFWMQMSTHFSAWRSRAGAAPLVIALLLTSGSGMSMAADGSLERDLLDAVHKSDLAAVQELLRAGASPDATDQTVGGGRTALMLALSNGRMDLAQALLERGANVNAATNYGATAIRFAVWGSSPRHVQMIHALVAAGADVDAGHAPSFRPKTQTCVVLVESAPCVALGRSAEGTALGDIAASNRPRNEDMMRALIAAGADVNARQPGWKTPLMIAAVAGNEASVRLLLASGADTRLKDNADRTALMLALEQGHGAVAELLRRAGQPGE